MVDPVRALGHQAPTVHEFTVPVHHWKAELRRTACGGGSGNDDVHLWSHQLGRELRQALMAPICLSRLEQDVRALDIAQLAQATPAGFPNVLAVEVSSLHTPLVA